ncbi:MAG: response regulator [Elusimicrobia bacterium]|nr:response regulator [Elusimicrobiota bacterium]
MATQIIIVDDDPIVGTLTLELLQEAGYTVVLVQDSLRAQQVINTERPLLVVLDILMPGLDGFTLLHRLKTSDATKDIKVIVVSGKSFEAEKRRAAQYGAEAFIEKPYDVDAFAKKVDDILNVEGGGVVKTPLPAAVPRPKRAEISATIWGCRSEGASSAAADSRYGRRTSCVSVDTGFHLFVFDAGSGIAALGEKLLDTGMHKDIWLFLTHFHPDHIEGLASFPCAREAGFTLHISGASDPDKPLEEVLKAAFESGPNGGAPAAAIDLYELIEQTYAILPGVRLSAFYANHPGTTLGFVLQADERKIVYCPDSELYGDFATALQDYDEKISASCRNADVMFHDGRYTPQDYKEYRNTGHSNFINAVDFAGKNNIKHLILVHQDARYTDEVLDQMGKDAQARVAERGYKLKVTIGREGLTVAV